ncbi:MAG: hypothetical protein M3Z85_22490, partial [Acidobacteriota bacterium]|nr:hypothetical protein [Acidobacteriota bacterium]
MTKVCTRGRDKQLGMRMLDESLRRLSTDWLDLWQIHGASFDNDPDRFIRRDGAAEALQQAKEVQEMLKESQNTGKPFCYVHEQTEHTQIRSGCRTGGGGSDVRAECGRDSEKTALGTKTLRHGAD